MYISELTLGPGPCGLRAGLAAQGCGHNLWGEVEEVSQVLDAFVGEVPVKMTPGKLLLDIPTGPQRLEEENKCHTVVPPTHYCKNYISILKRTPLVKFTLSFHATGLRHKWLHLETTTRHPFSAKMP